MTVAKEEAEEEQKQFEEEEKEKRVNKSTPKMSSTRAFEVFGMGVTSWMSHRTFDLIYRGLSKDLHPDIGGAVEDMAELNEAKEIARIYIR